MAKTKKVKKEGPGPILKCIRGVLLLWLILSLFFNSVGIISGPAFCGDDYSDKGNLYAAIIFVNFRCLSETFQSWRASKVKPTCETHPELERCICDESEVQTYMRCTKAINGTYNYYKDDGEIIEYPTECSDFYERTVCIKAHEPVCNVLCNEVCV